MENKLDYPYQIRIGLKTFDVNAKSKAIAVKRILTIVDDEELEGLPDKFTVSIKEPSPEKILRQLDAKSRTEDQIHIKNRVSSADYDPTCKFK